MKMMVMTGSQKFSRKVEVFVVVVVVGGYVTMHHWFLYLASCSRMVLAVAVPGPHVLLL